MGAETSPKITHTSRNMAKLLYVLKDDEAVSSREVQPTNGVLVCFPNELESEE